MIVKASDIKYLCVPKDSLRKKACGCVEVKISMMGSDVWITDYADGLCHKHLLEARKELKKQHKEAIEINKPKRKKKQ